MAGRLDFATRLETRIAAVSERLKPGPRLAPNVEIMAAPLLNTGGAA